MNSTSTLRGYQIKGRKGLNHWPALLEEWILCTERYCRVMDGQDAPFIYTERASIGLLAAAAWRCGRIALEEFQYEKGRGNKKRDGRADLYLASEDTEEMIEAKFDWLPLGSPEKAREKAESVLDDAVSDAKHTVASQPNFNCLGVAFLPTWLKSSSSSAVNDQIELTVSALSASARFHALAWCFPQEYRLVDNGAGRYTPGVIMVVANAAHT